MKTPEQMLADIKTLRVALKIVVEEASRPADQAKVRIKVCGMIARTAMMRTKDYDDPQES